MQKQSVINTRDRAPSGGQLNGSQPELLHLALDVPGVFKYGWLQKYDSMCIIF